MNDDKAVVDQNPAGRRSFDAFGGKPRCFEAFAHALLECPELHARFAGSDNKVVERLRSDLQIEHGDVHRAAVVERVDDKLNFLRYLG